MAEPYHGTTYKLPLIAVDTVTFPGMPVSFTLPNSQFIEAVTRAADRDSVVGLVLTRGMQDQAALANVYHVGTSASIRSIERTPYGSAEIFAIGSQRFTLGSIYQSTRNETMALINLLYDCDMEMSVISPAANRLHALVLVYLDLIAARLGEIVPPVSFPSSPYELSMCVASVVVAETSMKQELLEFTDTHQRLEQEIHWIQREIRRLRHEANQARTFALDDEQVREALRHMRN